MLNHLPNLRLATELPQQQAPADKLGGLPFGFTPSMWPKCKGCGGSMTLLAQFVHHPQRLNLGRDGRVLSVFHCEKDPGMCDNWDGASGANACLISEPDQLTDHLSTPPADNPPVLPEAMIPAWLETDDGIEESLTSSFFNDDAHSKLPEEVRSKPRLITRLGGVPSWLQSPDEAPKVPWQFAGQLDNLYHYFQPPPPDSPHLPVNIEALLKTAKVQEGPNFGDGGIGYIFLNPTSNPPTGWFFWACC